MLKRYELSRDQAAELLAICAACPAGQFGAMDPAYTAALNEWWLATGTTMGFRWSTVQQLEWLDASGGPIPLGFLQPHPCVDGARFLAESDIVEAAVEPDPDAMEWMNRRYCNSGPVTDDCKWSTTEMATAFAAGRDKGFAMGTATLSALESRLSEACGMLRMAAEHYRADWALHQAKVDALLAGGADDADTEAAIDSARSKARRSKVLTEAVGEFLADSPPTTAKPTAFEKLLESGGATVITVDNGRNVRDVGDADMVRKLARKFASGGFVGRPTHPGVVVKVVQVQEFTTVDPRFNPADPVTVNGFEFVRPADAGEVVQLRQLLDDAMPAVRLVNSIATLQDDALDTITLEEIRALARLDLGDDGFVVPPVYTNADLIRAVDAVREFWTGRVIDDPRELEAFLRTIAQALGLRRAG